MDLYPIFKSLEWVEDVTWDQTGLPDAFVSLLSHCKELANDRANVTMHQSAAAEVLAITESPMSHYDVDGPDMMSEAVDMAAAEGNFAVTLAGMCDIYYFLHSLNVFEIDSKSFNKLVALLSAEGVQGAPKHSEESQHAVDSLDQFLGKLENKYPGIEAYAHRIMLEANIVQEFGIGYETLQSFANELPTDGSLYNATLRCIAESTCKNMDLMQTLDHAHGSFNGSLSDYWPAACDFIWELFSDDNEMGSPTDPSSAEVAAQIDDLHPRGVSIVY